MRLEIGTPSRQSKASISSNPLLSAQSAKEAESETLAPNALPCAPIWNNQTTPKKFAIDPITHYFTIYHTIDHKEKARSNVAQPSFAIMLSCNTLVQANLFILGFTIILSFMFIKIASSLYPLTFGNCFLPLTRLDSPYLG